MDFSEKTPFPKDLLFANPRFPVMKELERKSKSKEAFKEILLQEVALADCGERKPGMTWSINTGTPSETKR